MDRSNERATAPLDVVRGVAAFDPTTLKIAAEALELDPGEALRPALSRTLSSLAEVTYDEGAVTARIDTGLLRWGEGLHPSTEDFTAYDGTEVYGVYLGKATVVNCDDAMVTSVPMRATATGNAPIRVWFAEFDGASGAAPELEGFSLLARTQRYEAQWRKAEDATLARTPTIITVPEQKLTYESEIPNALGVTAPVAGIRQTFAATMDETGARVIAETVICTGVPESFPPVHVFGSRGPVMFWFTEDGCELPFSIIYTTAEAWQSYADEEDDDDYGIKVVALRPDGFM